MNASNQLTRLMSDLAAHWTEPVLEILKAAGVQYLSVDDELVAWRALSTALRVELGWQRAFRSTTTVSLSALREQVLRRATWVLTRKHQLWPTSRTLEARIRQMIRDLRSTPAERELYAHLVRQPALRAAFKLPTRTDYFPRLQVSAVHA